MRHQGKLARAQGFDVGLGHPDFRRSGPHGEGDTFRPLIGHDAINDAIVLPGELHRFVAADEAGMGINNRFQQVPPGADGAGLAEIRPHVAAFITDGMAGGAGGLGGLEDHGAALHVARRQVLFQGIQPGGLVWSHVFGLRHLERLLHGIRELFKRRAEAVRRGRGDGGTGIQRCHEGEAGRFIGFACEGFEQERALQHAGGGEAGREAPELGGFILSGGEQGGGGGARRRLLQGGEDEVEMGFVEGRRGERGEGLQTQPGTGPVGSGQLRQHG